MTLAFTTFYFNGNSIGWYSWNLSRPRGSDYDGSISSDLRDVEKHDFLRNTVFEVEKENSYEKLLHQLLF